MTNSFLLLPFALTLLGEALAKAGRSEDALRRLDEAVRLVDVTQARWGEAELQRLRAEVLGALGRPEAAESGFRAAIAVAQRQSAKLWELRAATGLGHFWRDRARQHEARALLAPLHDWFTEGRDMRDLRAARELLDELR